MKDPLSATLFFNNFRYSTYNIQIQMKYFDWIIFFDERHDYCLETKQIDKIKINRYQWNK